MFLNACSNRGLPAFRQLAWPPNSLKKRWMAMQTSLAVQKRHVATFAEVYARRFDPTPTLAASRWAYDQEAPTDSK